MWDELYGKLMCINDAIPNVDLKYTRQGEVIKKLPWDNSKLVRKRKEKDKSWKCFDESPCMVNFQSALYKQREFERVEYNAKVMYETKIVKKLKYNCKPLFNYLRSKSKINKTVSSLENKFGNLTESPKDSAEVLADFFQSSFSLEKFGPLPEKCYKKIENHIRQIYSSTIVVTSNVVKKMLQELNMAKSMGPDDIHPKMLRYLSEDQQFVNALTELFNLCISGEEIPAIWKTATVVGLHKEGSVHLPDNYRPVSLTCILCKMFEKIIRKYILEYISDKIVKNQHGFVSRKSTLSNVLETIDTINEYLSEGNSADILYLDFSKAFDSVSHYRLLVKMQNYGISEKLINIVKYFLANRTMRVRVGNEFSDLKHVTSGVPQGSVLGPILFLIFINDLPDNVKCKMELFADDVKLLVGPKHCDIAQDDLIALNEWESMWNLKFNLNKCKVMHIGSNNLNYNYVFSGGILQKISSENDLGIDFNFALTSDSQIQSAVAKANSKIGWVCRNIVSRDPYVMTRIYKTIIRPHLEYCVQAWSPVARHGNWSLILKLENVQRRFTRLINGMNDFSYEDRLKKLNLTTLLERRMRGDLIETFKILNGFSDSGRSFFNLSSRTGNLVSRGIKKTNSVKQTDFFSHRVINFWNKLPSEVKNCGTVLNFKKKLDEYKNIGIQNHLTGNFWNLSDDIFNRI